MSIDQPFPAWAPRQWDTYRRIFGIAIESTGDVPVNSSEIEAAADRIAGRIALGGWYGLRADDRAHPLSDLGARLLGASNALSELPTRQP